MLVIAIAVFISMKFTSDPSVENHFVSASKDPFEKYRSDELHPEKEALIKDAFDSHMSYTYYELSQTQWFDSIAATGPAINKYGTTFILQSKSEMDDEKAKKFFEAGALFFADQTLDSRYKIDKLLLVNQNFKILKERDFK